MKAIIGIYNSEIKAREAVAKLVETGVKGDYIQLLSKYAWANENGEPLVVVDPNANIFNLDHNGLDVPFAEDIDAADGNIFKKKLTAILSNTALNADAAIMLERAEEAGYVVAVETDSSDVLDKASQVLRV
ncbi:MAG: hypothetical protein ABIR81_04170 [Ginsengibacter sp.]